MATVATRNGVQLKGGDIIRDSLGSEWVFLFAALPGLRQEPDGVVMVRRVGAGFSRPGRPFKPTFFPDIEISRGGEQS